MGRQFGIQTYLNIGEENKTSVIRTVIMLNRIILLLPFLCLVASKPQETPLAITYGGKQYMALLDKPAVVPATPPNECDGYSCNGIEYKVVTNNTDLFLGQCQTPLPDAGNDTFCFVNEDSACEKTKMDQFQGKYISTEPCQAINSPKKKGMELENRLLSGSLSPRKYSNIDGRLFHQSH